MCEKLLNTKHQGHFCLIWGWRWVGRASLGWPGLGWRDWMGITLATHLQIKLKPKMPLSRRCVYKNQVAFFCIFRAKWWVIKWVQQAHHCCSFIIQSNPRHVRNKLVKGFRNVSGKSAEIISRGGCDGIRTSQETQTWHNSSFFFAVISGCLALCHLHPHVYSCKFWFILLVLVVSWFWTCFFSATRRLYEWIWPLNVPLWRDDASTSGGSCAAPEFL